MERNYDESYQTYRGRYMPSYQGRSAPEVTTTDDLRVMIETLAHNLEVATSATTEELMGIRSHLMDFEIWKEEISYQMAYLESHQVEAMSVVEISDDSSEEGEEARERNCPARGELRTG